MVPNGRQVMETFYNLGCTREIYNAKLGNMPLYNNVDPLHTNNCTPRLLWVSDVPLYIVIQIEGSMQTELILPYTQAKVCIVAIEKFSRVL